TLFARPGSIFATAQDAVGIASARICVPATVPPGLLARAGVDPDVATHRRGSVAECFVSMSEGEADMVMADYLSAEAYLGLLVSHSEVVANDVFDVISSIHVAAPRE